MNWHNRPGKPGDPLCVVCGARAPYGTCDNVCTRAKRNGLTRGRQMFHDVRRVSRMPTPILYQAQGENRLCTDAIHYNRPYLAADYAA